jgi:RNA polymerase sigma-70 factor (ECF subfamily)
MRLNDSDRQLVNGCGKGDNESFRQLFNKHSSWMMGVCLRYSKNQDDAQDILQDCLIKIFKAIKDFNFQSDSQFVSWLKKIVVNTSLNHIKAQSANNFISLDNEQSLNSYIEESNDFDEDEYGFSQEVLLEYIQGLPTGYRTVFNLYVFEDYSHKDISELLNISESTSKSQLFKARNMLRNKIAKSIKQVAL